jgi:hypothetical protein
MSDLETSEAKGKFYLFLDQITDPQNFGSILRTAMFIGVDGILVNHRNACGLTPTVSKVSSGALEFIPLYSVRFVSKFLEDAQRSGAKFKVISTDIQSSNDDKGAPREVEPEVNVDDSDGDSKILREIKQERKQAAAPVKEAESTESEEEDDSKPFKANQVIAID